jgi:hypothetical protein
MKLLVFASAWTFGSLEACREEVRRGAFDGVEGPPPDDAAVCRAFGRDLAAEGIRYVAEIVTGGDYAPPSGVSEERHFADFDAGVARAVEAGALFGTCLTGSDSWPLARTIDYLGRAEELARRRGLSVSFETHRGRPTFNPWSTRDILLALPELRLTCDLSHWCVVCERLVDDEAALELALSRARHVHARVGYAQGPQVPDPRAPEHRGDLERHEAWWSRIWQHARKRADEIVTMTPEFGPDGYLHTAPFSREPVADLGEINRWMASRLRERFALFTEPVLASEALS